MTTEALTAIKAEDPMSFFDQNVDKWGAAEWFDRLAKAVHQQDKAVVEKDDVAFETYRMIASSSALALVREHEATVRAALSPTVGMGEERKTPAPSSHTTGGIEPIAFLAQFKWEQMTSAEPWLTNIVYSEDQSASFPCIPLYGPDKVKALEAENDRLRAMLAGCDWFWPEDDTSSDACTDGPWQIAENGDVQPGEVFGYSRGGVVETRYFGFLEAAVDAGSDDQFEADEPTREAAEAKIAAELERRAATTEGQP